MKKLFYYLPSLLALLVVFFVEGGWFKGILIALIIYVNVKMVE